MTYRFTLPSGHEVMVSDRDKALVKKYNWYYQKSIHHSNAYVKGYMRGGQSHAMKFRIHRVIMKARTGVLVDHRDGNTFNNTRRNLRTCSPAQSVCNSRKKREHKKYKGVYRDRQGKWYAQIYRDKVAHYLGSFGTMEEAAIAYNKAARRLHGRFARLNAVEKSP